MNQLVIVGKIVEITKAEIYVEVKRNYKNAEGEYEKDIIPCAIWEGVAEKTNEYCNVGDTIGVKGRLEIRQDELIIIAEKVSFLSAKREGNGKDE